MKETKKIIPFLVATCTVFALFHLNPPQEAHIAKIKAEYTEAHSRTWRVTWWSYERSLQYNDYLFFSVVKRTGRPTTIGIAGIVATVE